MTAKRPILTINGGLSSVKFALAGDTRQRVLAGAIERIGLPDSSVQVKDSNRSDDVSPELMRRRFDHRD